MQQRHRFGAEAGHEDQIPDFLAGGAQDIRRAVVGQARIERLDPRVGVGWAGPSGGSFFRKMKFRRVKRHRRGLPGRGRP